MPPGAEWLALSGGRTNRIWRVREASGDLVVKLYAAAAQTPLFRNDGAAEFRMLGALAGTGLAPEAVAGFETGAGYCVIYRHVEGRSWQGDPARVARALARLHALPPPSGLPRDRGGSGTLRRQTLAMLDECGEERASGLRALEPDEAVGPAPRLCAIHGDVVPANVIVTGGGAACLIDWQCPALGDPCEDIAIFLSPAMQSLYDGKPLRPEGRAAFFRAYGDSRIERRYLALAPWFHWRMAAYCLWKSERGERDYAAATELELEALAAPG